MGGQILPALIELDYAHFFLVACTQLYKPHCWSVGRSVGLFIGRSIGPSLNARSTRLMAIGLVSLLSIVNPFFFALYLSSFFSFFFHLHHEILKIP